MPEIKQEESVASQILVKFFAWADERIGDYRDIPTKSPEVKNAKIFTLQGAKDYLRGIVEEVTEIKS